MSTIGPVTIALDTVDLGGADGAVWSLPHDGDLDANLVKLSAGGVMAAHHNTEVDVLVVVISGTGTLTVDGHTLDIDRHHLARVPTGALRSLAAGPDGLVYLTVHPARPGLRIGPPPAG